MEKTDLGKRIKELRKSRNLRQDDLAKILGLSRGAISNLEHSRRGLTISQLRKLCSYFKVDMDYFYIKPDTEETIQLLERAKLLFESDIPDEEKEEVYSQIMKMYLKFKGTI